MRRYLVSRKISPRNAFSVSKFTPVAVPDSEMITIMFFILLPFLERDPISSSIWQGTQKEGRRRVDVNHTSTT